MIDESYVISLDHDNDKYINFMNSVKDNSWTIKKFRAINGRNLTEQNIQLKNKYIHNNNWLNPGEIGCSLSHISLWEMIANDKNLNRIAIFEDDARSHLDGKAVLNLINELYNYLNENNIEEPDVLYLGKALDDCLSYERVYKNVFYSKHPLCTHAYIITKKGAIKLLNTAPYNCAIDMVLVNAIEQKIITAMTFHPSIYFQDIFLTSNLRKLSSMVNNTSECLINQQHITGTTWQFSIFAIIALLACCILFFIYFRYY